MYWLKLMFLDMLNPGNLNYAPLMVKFGSQSRTITNVVDFSRGIGYPLLWPSADCRQPLDVSSDFTFKVIDGILSGDNAFLKYLLEIRFSEISRFPDFSKVFKYKFVHLGGDEVDTSEFLPVHMLNYLFIIPFLLCVV